MSHFCVVVLGDNVEDQLQPFHEYECTGIKDQYVVEVDMTEEVKADYVEYGDDHESIEEFAKGWTSARRTDDGRWVRLTNPNAKWDWWAIGGRWSGWLGIDQGKRRDFDFDALRAKEAIEAASTYRQLRPTDIEPPDVGWDEWRERSANIDEARQTWHAHPFVAEFNKRCQDLQMWGEAEKFMVPEDEYIAGCVASACSPYAIVAEGAWRARGEMSWFGISTDETSATDWNAFCREMIEGAPEDMLLTVVDCHI